MNDEVRNLKQIQFAQDIRKHRRSILRSSIRFGKTKVGLMTIDEDEKILIAYPRLVIKDSWLKDIAKFGVASDNITFSTFKSLPKLEGQFDYVIADEFHKLSPKQVGDLMSKVGKRLLLITGTLKASRKKFWLNKGIPLAVEYDLEDAINDKLVKDYRVYIHYVKLGEEESSKYSRLTSTIDWAIDNKELSILANNREEVKKFDMISKKNINLRTNLLYNTQVTKDYAKGLIDKYKNEKVLIFALRTAVADELAEKSFHSKSKDSNNLEEFMVSEDGHLSTVNVINEGITISHLNHIICHTVTSNTEDFQQKLGRGLQLGEVDDEICQIHLICIKGTVSEKWVDEACKSLNQEKIFVVNKEEVVSKIFYTKLQYPDKELYLYEGSFCYKVGENTYKFLNDKVDREYSLWKVKKL